MLTEFNLLLHIDSLIVLTELREVRWRHVHLGSLVDRDTMGQHLDVSIDLQHGCVYFVFILGFFQNHMYSLFIVV